VEDMQQRLGSNSFDIVVMNGLMPGRLSAQEIYEWIAKNCAGLEKRLLLTFSTLTDDETRGFLREQGVPSLAKPFEVADLISRVRDLSQRELNRAIVPSDMAGDTKEDAGEKATVAGAGS
jgi:DNA-binding response OmpR family regulator